MSRDKPYREWSAERKQRHLARLRVKYAKKKAGLQAMRDTRPLGAARPMSYYQAKYGKATS